LLLEGGNSLLTDGTVLTNFFSLRTVATSHTVAEGRRRTAPHRPPAATTAAALPPSAVAGRAVEVEQGLPLGSRLRALHDDPTPQQHHHHHCREEEPQSEGGPYITTTKKREKKTVDDNRGTTAAAATAHWFGIGWGGGKVVVWAEMWDGPPWRVKGHDDNEEIVFQKTIKNCVCLVVQEEKQKETHARIS
jgi:hypothetical protein